MDLGKGAAWIGGDATVVQPLTVFVSLVWAVLRMGAAAEVIPHNRGLNWAILTDNVNDNLTVI